MRYLKPAFVAFVAGVLLAAAVLSIEIAHAQSSIAQQMTNCADYVCDAYAQVGGLKLLGVSFMVGFATAFFWFQRRHRRVA